MAKSKTRHPEPTDALAEIESVGERAVEWVENNARIVLSVIVGCLVLASAYGLYDSGSDERRDAAFDALAEVRVKYLAAMGASPWTYSLALALGEDVDVQWLTAFSEALAAEQKQWGVSLIGGDTVRTGGATTLTVSMLARTAGDRLLRRSGAQRSYGNPS